MTRRAEITWEADYFISSKGLGGRDRAFAGANIRCCLTRAAVFVVMVVYSLSVPNARRDAWQRGTHEAVSHRHDVRVGRKVCLSRG